MAEPRSTCRNLLASSEQNLSELPPDTEPLTALSGVSFALHDREPVAGRFNARFPGGGGGGGWLPSSYDGGASSGPLPQELADEPSVKSTVPPLLNSDPGIQVLVWDTPLTDSDWMKKFDVDACGALMVTVLPFIRWISTCVNSGAFSVTSAVPRFSG